jgi:hypothetical protein
MTQIFSKDCNQGKSTKGGEAKKGTQKDSSETFEKAFKENTTKAIYKTYQKNSTQTGRSKKESTYLRTWNRKYIFPEYLDRGRRNERKNLLCVRMLKRSKGSFYLERRKTRVETREASMFRSYTPERTL